MPAKPGFAAAAGLAVLLGAALALARPLRLMLLGPEVGAALGVRVAATTGFTLSATPFTFRTAYNDAVPTIHVGFTNDASQADGAAITYKDSSRCEITGMPARIKAAAATPGPFWYVLFSAKREPR